MIEIVRIHTKLPLWDQGGHSKHDLREEQNTKLYKFYLTMENKKPIKKKANIDYNIQHISI